MKTLDVVQGTPAWKAARAQHDCASDAPAMMGESKYTTRNELLKQRATGIIPEIDSGTQYLFDKGHAAEAAIRPHAEKIVGDDLYAMVGVEGSLLASFDGITMDESTIFEHKLWSESAAAMVRSGTLEPAYYWQVEHQLLVSGAKRCLFMVSDGTPEKCVHLWYAPVAGRAEALLAGWKQFHQDVQAYKPEPAKVEVIAAHVEGFGALSLRVEGKVLASNLDAFKAGAEAFIARLPKPADLQTDQDFANAESAVKACADAETRIKAAKDAALGQMADVDAVLRAADSIAETIRAARLALDKVVKSEKETRKADLVRAGVDAVREHYASINATLPGFELSVPAGVTGDLGAAIKGLRSIDSIRDKIGSAVANIKIAASQDADRRRACIAVLPADRSLVPDAAALVASKTPDDLRNLIAARVAAHEKAEAEKLERERARIRAEEEARAKREADARAEQDRQRIRDEERAKAQADAAKAAPAPESKAVTARAAAVAPAAPTGASPEKAAGAAPTPASRKTRPTDAELIEVLALHYRVHESKVIEWLLDVDLNAASAAIAEAL